ncbi:MFS general substrate transporter-26 [Coleophoma cylindrospora]|uniref:MFS general substrate transporter-26 n=1 Tax=Coleophoma cylindrospora TaxID=1849047 RepID=A0A3D8S175_9HELO|nr:MFS general substrate transporter-26 [Coleophoma cylindrospora]
MASGRSVQTAAAIRARSRDGAHMDEESGLVSPLGERAPLLRPGRSGSDDGSEGTLANASDEHDGDKPNQSVSRTRGLFIMLSLWGLIFLQASNVSVIAVTQSIIAEELDAFTETSWFTSAYLIAMSSCAPLAGRLATIFSPRNCMFFASVLFALGGLVTASASALPVFLLGRAISGVGGAGIMTITFVLVLELCGKKRRGLFVGLANTGFTSGVALGAVLAGALVGATGWRFLFLVQSPLALLAGLGVAFSIPKSFSSSASKAGGERSMWSKLTKIDYIGAVTLTLAIVLFLYGLSAPKIAWLPVILSFITFPCFLYIEICFASDPIIPVTVLKSRGALLSCFAQLGIMASRWMVLFYTPVYALSIRGWSPASAGSILVPTNMGFAAGSVLAGALHIRRAGSFWSACIICYSLFVSTLVVLGFISNPATPTWAYVLATFCNGLFVGAALNYTLAHVLHLTPPDTHYVVASLLNTFRGFAGSFGSAIGGGFFIRVLQRNLETGFKKHGLTGKENLLRRLLGSPVLVQGLEGAEKIVAVEAYVGAFKTLFWAGSGLAIVMVLVQAGTGWKVGQVTEEEREEVGVVRGEVEGGGGEDSEAHV